MSVKIELYPFLYQYIENSPQTAQVDGKTVGECLEQLISRYPQLRTKLFDKKGKLYLNLHVYLNGENAYPDELTRRVRDGDQVHILPINTGG